MFRFPRQREEEWMDRPNADPRELARSLKFIRRVNSLLGYTRATIAHVEMFSQTWPRGRAIRVIDFATGSGDIPRAILNWATGKNFNVEIVGLDLHADTARIARSEVRDDRFTVVRGDAMNAPFADGSFDYALTAMFLHHLSEEDAARVLTEMNRVAERGIIAADILRNRRAYSWISLFTLLSNPMVRHDARVSVRQAFSREEILALRDRAGLEYAKYFAHFGHRFVLAGEKSPFPISPSRDHNSDR